MSNIYAPPKLPSAEALAKSIRELTKADAYHKTPEAVPLNTTDYTNNDGVTEGTKHYPTKADYCEPGYAAEFADAKLSGGEK